MHLPNTLVGTPGKELEQSEGNICLWLLAPKCLLTFPAFRLVEAMTGMCKYIPKVLPAAGQKEPETERQSEPETE